MSKINNIGTNLPGGFEPAGLPGVWEDPRIGVSLQWSAPNWWAMAGGRAEVGDTWRAALGRLERAVAADRKRRIGGE